MADRAMGDQSNRRPFKIGLLVDNVGLTTPGGVPPRWSDMLAFAHAVEDAGFDSLWLGDHLLAAPITDGACESWSLLTALAAATRRVELVTNVACTGFRNPALLAKMADTADEISGGRLLLGLGAGWHEPEFQAFGYPFDHRVSRFEEALHIIRTLLREGHVDFAGRFHQARGCDLRPRGPRPQGPPIMIGTTGERMLEPTARWADAWNGFLAARRDAAAAPFVAPGRGSAGGRPRHRCRGRARSTAASGAPARSRTGTAWSSGRGSRPGAAKGTRRRPSSVPEPAAEPRA